MHTHGDSPQGLYLDIVIIAQYAELRSERKKLGGGGGGD